MNELEQMLRADLRDVAGTVDIPISVDAVAAERDRLDTEERRAHWGGTGNTTMQDETDPPAGLPTPEAGPDAGGGP